MFSRSFLFSLYVVSCFVCELMSLSDQNGKEFIGLDIIYINLSIRKLTKEKKEDEPTQLE